MSSLQHLQCFMTAHTFGRITQSFDTVLVLGDETQNLAQSMTPQAQYCIANHMNIAFSPHNPCFTASFDLIIYASGASGISNPKETIHRLAACLKPGGKLYITCLGNNSFYEQRTECALQGRPCNIADFITFGQLKSWLPLSGIRHVEEEWLSVSSKTEKTSFQILYAIYTQPEKIREE